MTKYRNYLTLILILLISGCNQTKYNGHYKIGPAYIRQDQKYYPKEEKNYEKIGLASWYSSKKFHGKKTANGDRYNKNMLTAAHPTLPLPCIIEVTNLKNAKSLKLMVNDRGPFKKGRIVDVSEKAADILAFKKQGITKVKVKYLEKETKDLHHKLSLNPKKSKKALGKIKSPTCSVNCYLKKINNRPII